MLVENTLVSLLSSLKSERVEFFSGWRWRRSSAVFRSNLDSSNRDDACARPPRTQGEIFYILDSCHVSKSVRRGKIRKKIIRIWLKTSTVQNHKTSSVLLKNGKTQRPNLMCVNVAALYNYQGMASSKILLLFFFLHTSLIPGASRRKKNRNRFVQKIQVLLVIPWTGSC